MATSAKSRRNKKTNGTSHISNRIFEDVLAVAATLLRSRKDFGADKLHSLAEATRGYAASMADLPNLRAHVASASETIEGLAEYVMHTDIEHMVQDAGTFARRHPLATLGVTVAAGLAASRLMRTSQPDAEAKPRRAATKKKSRKTAAPRRGTNGSAQAHA